jgi:uncharacterized membrane protein
METRMSSTTKVYIVVFCFTAIGIILALRDREKFATLRKDFSDPIFLTALAFIIAFVIYGVNSSQKRVRNATQHSLIAFVIAYLACLNMPFLAFFLTGGYFYYLDETP